ncbi:hypothetical protein WOSG25_010230 [Weissella oryzae SG25]|uniref:Uncharacterized protein n=1 Tax=Weissella oryzae (strain DSM 25784 / JCM 18191 / LMG 30913 / SG25) TaxID=1329250 RepID=A0A069CXY6_WEIOS|nr:hypothetical protein WOSG25_010230 [Weissella oryzae SG25]
MQGQSNVLNKVPEITVTFWLAKLITTGLGESWSDFFDHTWGPLVDLIIGLSLFDLFLFLQLRQKRYRPINYWLTLVGLAVFGTFVADASHGLGLSYRLELVLYGGLMVLAFYLWFKKEHSLSIHEITSRSKELFYWITVFCSFVLGTAVGDFMAHILKLGTLWSGVLLSGLFVIILGLRLRLPQAEVLTFWLAYILTRPIGASFANYFAYTWHAGQLGVG